jgi:hypothetical protein
MISDAALTAFVREQFGEMHGPDGVPYRVPQWVLERFAARFLGPARVVRENAFLSRTEFTAPSSEEIQRINALWLELRVQRFGEAARVPTPRSRFTLPDAVRELLGKGGSR